MTRVLYCCPKCGDKVFDRSQGRGTRNRHPKLDQIHRDLAKGVQISIIRAKYKLTKGAAAGIKFRFWDRVQETRRLSR